MRADWDGAPLDIEDFDFDNRGDGIGFGNAVGGGWGDGFWNSIVARGDGTGHGKDGDEYGDSEIATHAYIDAIFSPTDDIRSLVTYTRILNQGAY